MSSVYKGTDLLDPAGRAAAFVLRTDRPELAAIHDRQDGSDGEIGLTPEELREIDGALAKIAERLQ